MKWMILHRQYVQMHNLLIKLTWSNIIDICSEMFRWQQASIVSGNDLVFNWQEVISQKFSSIYRQGPKSTISSVNTVVPLVVYSLKYIYTGWHIQQSCFTIWSCGVNTSYHASSNKIHNMNYLTLKYSIKTILPLLIPMLTELCDSIWSHKGPMS